MTHKQFINELAKNAGMTTSETTDLMNSFIKTLVDSAQNEKTIMLQGFGSFEKKTKAERKMYNPSTKEYRIISGSNTLAFKPSTLLKDKLNQDAK